ncbi:MAG: SIMPL domain-containing protein [Candidatus Limnocylindrales bacterium]
MAAMTTTVTRMTRHEARSWMVITGLVGIIVGALLVPMVANGQEPPTGTASTEHTISVTGSGKIFVKPDMADVSIGVQVIRASLREARDDAARQMNAVLDALHALGITDADIETAYLDISPTYDYSGQSQRITGYQVSNQLTVHVKNLDQLAAVVDDSVNAGASTIQGITFKVSDQTAAEAQARTAAGHDARARADALAAAAGVTITGVASISETSFTPPIWYGMPAARDEAGAPTPIIPGMSLVSIDVSVVYVIG